MKCKKCKSEKILGISAHCSDSFSMQYKGKDYQSYVPMTLNIGGSDDVEMDICMECGTIQADWPISDKTIEEEFKG